MEKNTLVQVFATFSRQEWRELDGWLRTPLHNKDPEVIQLFEYLQGQIQAGQSLPEAPEVARLALLPGRQHTDHLHHVSSYLMKAVSDYLLWAELNRQPLSERQHRLSEILRRRQLGKQAARFQSRAEEGLQRQASRGRWYYELHAAIQQEKVQMQEWQNTLQHHNLQPLLVAQDLRFLVEKLQTGCLLLSQKAVSAREYDPGLLDLLTQLPEEHPYLQEPAVALYYHGYRALSKPDGEPHFRQLKLLLARYGELFKGDELRNLYLLAVNFCIRRINRSERVFLREVFELYQSGLAQGAFLEQGQLSRFTYTNIAQAGMGLGEFAWVSQFLQEHKTYLPKDIREPVSQFNLARLYYETGETGKALACLLNIGYDDTVYNFAAKTLLAKIYYARGEWNALDSLLDSISAYIRRKKVAGYHRDSYLGFVKIMRRLLSSDLSQRAQRATLREKIAAMKVLAEREWLAGLVG